jgi:hypothetical protein
MAIKKTYTGMNVRDCSDEQLQRLKSWIKVSRAQLNGEQWLLVVEPILARGKEVYCITMWCPRTASLPGLNP